MLLVLRCGAFIVQHVGDVHGGRCDEGLKSMGFARSQFEWALTLELVAKQYPSTNELAVCKDL